MVGEVDCPIFVLAGNPAHPRRYANDNANFNATETVARVCSGNT